MVENAYCQDIVEKRQASRRQDFNELACSRYLENKVLYIKYIVLFDKWEIHGKLSSGFSTIIWVLARFW
jgi:hypothetical protein